MLYHCCNSDPLITLTCLYINSEKKTKATLHLCEYDVACLDMSVLSSLISVLEPPYLVKCLTLKIFCSEEFRLTRSVEKFYCFITSH